MNVLFGVSASDGLGLGKAFVVPETEERIIPKNKISSGEAKREWKRFEKAVEKEQKKIENHLSTLEAGNIQRTIFETYQLMLSDPVFIEEVKKSLNTELFNIEYVLENKVRDYADKLRSSGNDYLADRAHDIEDVFDRVIDSLIDFHPFNIEEVPDDVVIVAKGMKTSDTVILAKRKIAGLALTEGGISSHVAILAKSYGIPAVVGLKDVIDQVQNDDFLIVDGTLGELIVQPDELSLKEYKEKLHKQEEYRRTLEKYRDFPGKTKDGTRFNLYANIGSPEEVKLAIDAGADGIGLFRTEFLFMSASNEMAEDGYPLTSPLSEETQFQAYKQVLEAMGDKPVTIRTLDAGGDKLIHSKEVPDMHEKNPLMGLRAVRLSLSYPHILRTQLRALYRASVYGNLKILLPLITTESQVETIKGIAKGVQLQLKSEHIPFKEDVPIGIMVETAAAAIISDCLAPRCDFFSLGTNDLTQYTLGIDRENPAVAPLYNEFHLAVLRMIEMTVKNAKSYNIPVSVCGEMGGRKESLIVLSGMGIRNLSMSPKQIPVIKETLAQFTIEELENISRTFN